MPFNQKEYIKLYREQNKDKLKEYQKLYKEQNREKLRQCKKEYQKLYREQNKERITEYILNYRQTENGIKRTTITCWKLRGVSQDYDFDIIYDIYINTHVCDYCNKTFIQGEKRNCRCLDHDHETGEIRGILCGYCNLKDVLKINLI